MKNIQKINFFWFFFVLFFSISFFLAPKYYVKFQGMMDFVFQKEVSDQKYDTTNPLEKASLDQFGVVTRYDFMQGYYDGGRPQEKDLGVCTDVVVDAMKIIGIDLQEEIYKDMQEFPQDYDDVLDRNINHRRAKNIGVYMSKYHQTLPLDFSEENLDTWKGGDLIIWENHIAIVSSQKRADGAPYVISNHGSGTILADIIETWTSPLTGHYRLLEESL